MREPRRFPRPSRHVTPSQKASSPEKLTRSHPPKERAASCGSRSNGCVHKAGKHVAKIPCNRNRNRNLAFTKQKNMSPFRKTYIRHTTKERAASRLAVERLRPQSRKTCRENPPQPQPQSRIHKAEKHVALQKNIHSPSPRGARRLAARGRTVASTNQENMSQKTNATATATSHPQSRKTCRPSEKHTFAIPQRSAPPRGSRPNGCVHKAEKHVAKIPCNRNRNRLDDCSCLLLICYRTDGNIVWVLRKS